MKMKDFLTYNNCLSIHDQINEKLPNTFAEYFIIPSNQHSYNTRGSKFNTNTTFTLMLFMRIG